MDYDEEIKRMWDVISDEQRRKEVLGTTGEKAQEWLDLMQLLVEYSETDKPFRSAVFKMMIRLSRATGLHPKCLTIQNVEMLGNHPVGGGAFGDVWKGSMGESIVCMKVLRVYSATEVEQVLKDYMQEAIVWRQLDHPNLLPFLGIYHMDDDMKRVCLVSPWMERGNLVQFMKDTPDLVDPISLASDVACGLSYLHDMKVVHGDLKGVNILITPDLKACIGDFGLARVTDTQRLFSLQTNHSKGTMRWLAPELLRPGPDCVSSRESDVYAYACVCYEIFTGRVPFSELSDPAVIFAVLIERQHPSRPIDLPGLTDTMWSLMMSCWYAEPSSRPTMADVIAGLRPINSGGLSEASSLASDPPRATVLPYPTTLDYGHLSMPDMPQTLDRELGLSSTSRNQLAQNGTFKPRATVLPYPPDDGEGLPMPDPGAYGSYSVQHHSSVHPHPPSQSPQHRTPLPDSAADAFLKLFWGKGRSGHGPKPNGTPTAAPVTDHEREEIPMPTGRKDLKRPRAEDWTSTSTDEVGDASPSSNASIGPSSQPNDTADRSAPSKKFKSAWGGPSTETLGMDLPQPFMLPRADSH
ncbi:hypothetical protein PQX77_014198 [Marasmius sp. AFHP31]|nr:hypothetical protein PQX77_014198 [Marasmius sp. AFHP31]